MSNVRQFPGRLRVPRADSFTLVEVVFAIAIIAFILVSLLGLMSYTSQLVHQADTYSRLSDIVGQISARFDSQPFATSTNCANTNATYYFTSEGIPTNSPGGFYQCTVSNANAPNWTSTNVMQIQMIICWPKPQFTNTNVIVTSTLNYD
jgi:uncharacterized protein (TIGR02598 family)